MKQTHPKLKSKALGNRGVTPDLMMVSQLAAAADEPAHAVRYYCRIGLLKPVATSAGNYRLFDQDVLHRLRFIRLAQGLGFTLEEVGGFFGHAASGTAPCPEVKEILDRRLPQIGLELAKLEALHARMTRARKRWRHMRGGIPTGTEICRLIESEDGS